MVVQNPAASQLQNSTSDCVPGNSVAAVFQPNKRTLLQSQQPHVPRHGPVGPMFAEHCSNATTRGGNTHGGANACHMWRMRHPWQRRDGLSQQRRRRCLRRLHPRGRAARGRATDTARARVKAFRPPILLLPSERHDQRGVLPVVRDLLRRLRVSRPQHRHGFQCTLLWWSKPSCRVRCSPSIGLPRPNCCRSCAEGQPVRCLPFQKGYNAYNLSDTLLSEESAC